MADGRRAFRPWCCGPRPYTRRMSDDEPLREQLIEARDRIRRELEILRSPSSIGGGADSRSVIAALQSELAEIEAALANRG